MFGLIKGEKGRGGGKPLSEIPLFRISGKNHRKKRKKGMPFLGRGKKEKTRLNEKKRRRSRKHLRKLWQQLIRRKGEEKKKKWPSQGKVPPIPRPKREGTHR